MLVRDKKTGRFLNQKKSNEILAFRKETYEKSVVDKVKKSYTLPLMVLYGIIVILAIALIVV